MVKKNEGLEIFAVSNRIDGSINLASLAAIQGGNALIPLFLFPYLLSTLGAEKFSVIASFEAFSFIILTLSLYSFDVSGLKKIVESSKQDLKCTANTYYSILYARLLIFSGVATLSIFFAAFYIPDMMTVFMVWLAFPLGITLQSSYYYQAKSDNLPLAVFVVIPRMATILFAILFLNKESSVLFASILVSLSYLMSGLVSIIYLLFSLGFISPFRLLRKSIVLIKEGYYIFFGGVSVLLYRGSNTLLLNGLGGSPVAISSYAIAEKYIKMIQAVTFPLTQVYAVRAVRALASQKLPEKINSTLWNNTKYQVVISSALSVSVLLVSEVLCSNQIWDQTREIRNLLALMLFSVLFGTINYMYGTIGLSSLGQERVYARVVFIAGITTVIVSSGLIVFISAVGAAIAYAFGEIFLTFLLLRVIRKLC